MRRNNYTSAADRRWRRRYERILQRKEEEAERQERQSSGSQEIQYILDGSASLFDMTEPMISDRTYTVSISESDILPNKNGTVITWDEYGTGIHDGHRNVAESNVSVARGGNKQTTSDDMYYKILKAWDDFISKESQQAELRGQGYWARNNIYDEWFGEFVDQEPDLEVGDNSMLDSFLEDFISPGA